VEEPQDGRDRQDTERGLIGHGDIAVILENSREKIPPQKPGKVCQDTIVILGTNDKEQIAKPGGSSDSTESDENEVPKKLLCSNIVKITIGVLILLILIVGIITGSVKGVKITKSINKE